MDKKDNVITLPVAIIVAALLVGGAIFLRGGGPVKNIFGPVANQPSVVPLGETGASSAKNPAASIRPISATDHILGNPSASVVVVEYSDLECPFCKIFHATMHQIIDEYGKKGTVAWVYRNMPIDQLHPKARNEAGAAECAASLGGNEKYWQFIDGIFAVTPSNNRLDPTELPKIANQIGLDEKKFSDCLASSSFASKIETDYNEGVAAGADGTPYSLAIGKNGKSAVINGAQPYSYVKSQIDSLLAGQ